MKKGIIRVGETEGPALVPDGGLELDGDVNETKRTNRYNGKLEKLMSMLPAPGSADADGFTVTNYKLKNKPAGQAVLEIYYVKAGLTAQSSGAVSQRIRISWARSQRPLRQHPLWDGIDGTIWAMVDRWEEEKDDVLKSSYQYRVPQIIDGSWQKDAETGEYIYDTRIVSGSVHNYCDKRLQGIDSYDVFHPVVTRTRNYVLEPTTGGCGKIDTSNCPRRLTGYQFLKVADDCDNNGSRGLWTRTEQWEGYERIDSDIYATTASMRKVIAQRKAAELAAAAVSKPRGKKK